MTLMRVLCVAEKPAIARALSAALGGGAVQTRTSPNKFVRNFDLTYVFPQWGSCEVTVTSVLGHVTDIEFVSPYNEWKTPVLELYGAPIKTILTKEGATIARNIKQESRTAQKIYIWTDGDREGEHIGGEAVEIARAANPRIEVYRALFNNVDPQHLRQAACRPVQLDWQAVAAVDVRRELDLRTGFSMTRFQTGIYRKAFPQLKSEGVISYGSCQFPTLGFVVDRYLRIKNFKTEPFWHIQLSLKLNEQQKALPLHWERGHIFDRMVATIFYERMMDQAASNGYLATVVGADKKPTKRYRPLPLTTVRLQKSGAQFLKLSSKRVMDVAEKLYNKGFISYPRTETDKFDPSMDLNSLLSRQSNHSIWGEHSRIICGYGADPRQGKHDDKAHPPIHPIKAIERHVLDADEWKVYEFVTRHFLACCGRDAKGETTTVRIKYGEDEYFKASGDVVLEPNFLEVYIYQKWDSTQLPNLQIGQTVPVTSAMLKQGSTTPPGPLTEPELISLMDTNGIGTDATMADHIDRIIQRQFVTKESGKFYPTNLGVALVQSYDKIGFDNEQSLTKPFLRRETERLMTSVADGQLRKQDAKKRLIEQYRRVFMHSTSHSTELLEEARKYLV